VAQEKTQAFNGKRINGQFQFDRDKTVFVNHYYFYIDDADFGTLFIKVCSYAPWSVKVCLNGINAFEGRARRCKSCRFQCWA
jgi:hypothetical protein